MQNLSNQPIVSEDSRDNSLNESLETNEDDLGRNTYQGRTSPLLPPDIRNSVGSFHLDFVRAFAAFAVLAYHIRYRFFVDYRDLHAQTVLSKVFYFATAFGHDAVMVFFVLSGFLISSTVIRDRELQRWCWAKYLLDRLTRLYVVLLPGLLLTLVWDSSGLHLFGGNAVYSGVSTDWIHDFFDVKNRLSTVIALGNTSFLQTILVPPFGSNDPLWSLAYEFWYYLLFPCLYIALKIRTSIAKRLGLFIIALAILCFVGKSIVFYFPIWLLGTVVCFVPKPALFSDKRKHRIALAISLIVFAFSTISGHIGFVRAWFGGSVIFGDYLTAIGFAFLMYVLIHDPQETPSTRYAWLARTTSSFSYTLYVVHMPLLVFLRAALISGKPWQPSLPTIGAAVLLTAVSICYAIMIARMTESKTPQVRRILRKIVA